MIGGRASGSPASIPKSAIRSESLGGSAKSFRSQDDDKDEWDAQQLLGMTDTVREALRVGSIPSHDLEVLCYLLGTMLDDEHAPGKAVDLTLISNSCLDKLVEDLQKCVLTLVTGDDACFKEILARACTLEHKWQQRLKSAYFSLDNVRIQEMKRNGALRDLVLNPEYKMNSDIWIVNYNKGFAQKEGDDGFHTGQWWLNIQCAFRDGIVARIDEKATRGLYGVTALPLLTGEEKEGPTLNMYEYVNRGTFNEMPLCLMTTRGARIRVLRGHTLKSKFAPKAGVRYDGL